jgi:hypothetical protein
MCFGYSDRMAVKRSAGLLLFRRRSALEVLLAHPGGPFWARRDAGGGSIPKGEYDADEAPLAAARWEFFNEPGLPATDRARLPLGEIRQPSGKLITAWAVELISTRPPSSPAPSSWNGHAARAGFRQFLRSIGSPGFRWTKRGCG